MSELIDLQFGGARKLKLEPKQKASKENPYQPVNITTATYRPSTKDELVIHLNERKEQLEAMGKDYKEAKVALRDAIDAYRRAESGTEEKETALNEVLNKQQEMTNVYVRYSKENPFNERAFNIHEVKYYPIRKKFRVMKKDGENLQFVPTKSYPYRELTFDKYRDTTIPTPVGILTYPEANPSSWYFTRVLSQTGGAEEEPAELSAEVGPEGRQKSGSEGPKQQLSSRQIGAIIAARKARRF